MSFIIDGEVHEDEFAYAAQQIIGKPTEATPPVQKPSFDKDWHSMVDDIIMSGPAWKPYKGWNEKGDVEDRRDDAIATTPPPPDAQSVAEFYGDNINPKEYVMDPIAHDAGVNKLNEMIVRKESQVRHIPNAENDVIKGPANPKSDIDQLLEKLDRLNKKKK